MIIHHGRVLKKQLPKPEHSGSAGSKSVDGSWEQTWLSTAEESNEEVTPFSSMRKIFT